MTTIDGDTHGSKIRRVGVGAEIAHPDRVAGRNRPRHDPPFIHGLFYLLRSEQSAQMARSATPISV